MSHGMGTFIQCVGIKEAAAPSLDGEGEDIGGGEMCHLWIPVAIPGALLGASWQ